MKIILLLLFLSSLVFGHSVPGILKEIKFEQKLGASLNQNILVSNEEDKKITLGNLLGAKPTLFVFSYGDCKTLCSLILNGVIKSLNTVKLAAGKDFQVLILSIDPKESRETLVSRRGMVAKRYLKSPDALGWHFLRAQSSAIKLAASELGFHYAYDPVAQQYAHASGIVFLTPQGKVSSYLMGVEYPPLKMQSALEQAGRSKSGSVVADLLLYCFHYDPSSNKYGQLILTALKVSGCLMVVLILCGLFFLSRAKRSKA
jgi:protein SCO1/2